MTLAGCGCGCCGGWGCDGAAEGGRGGGGAGGVVPDEEEEEEEAMVRALDTEETLLPGFCGGGE